MQYGLVPHCTWSDIPMRCNDVTTTYYSLLVSYTSPLVVLSYLTAHLMDRPIPSSSHTKLRSASPRHSRRLSRYRVCVIWYRYRWRQSPPDTHVQEVRYRVERHVPLIHLVVQALEVQEREILEEVYLIRESHATAQRPQSTQLTHPPPPKNIPLCVFRTCDMYTVTLQSP